MIELTEQNFEKETSEGLVIVDCYANWCGKCKLMAPLIEQAEQKFKQYKFCKLDVEKCPKIAEQIGIMNLPTIILYKDGKIFDRGEFNLLANIEGAK